MNLEKRAIGFEIRTDGRRLEGYAAVFNERAEVGSFTEVILPGAFRTSLSRGRDILGLVDHDQSKILGRTRSGTLHLSEDQRGLAFVLDVPETQLGHDILALAGRGDLGGMSFGFLPNPGGERWNNERRELIDVELHEISVISAWPAYAGTSVQPRNHTPRRALARRFMETV